jgi:hypothetical protein
VCRKKLIAKMKKIAFSVAKMKGLAGDVLKLFKYRGTL